ncbi:hypothetical protein DPMN_078372 [Dreissena polymorpha]|uniref:Uncharacterized protein n=1 Tax=Dreissena polymorpha TaxID=45954 RepID=A0A9D4BQ61_DREPO|nr:hypothetical protein DPMN_078372 [Dreissena polymorpha]
MGVSLTSFGTVNWRKLLCQRKNPFGINPSVFNEPFDESTNANVNLNKSHLESLTETKSKTENSENISDATEITTEDVQKFFAAEDNKNTIRKTLSVDFNNILRRRAKRRQSTIYQSTILMNILPYICSLFARVMVINSSLSHCVASWEALSGNSKEQSTHTLSFGAVQWSRILPNTRLPESKAEISKKPRKR